MAAKKKRLIHSLPEVGHSRRDLQDNGLFTLLPQSSLSLFCKRNWHSDPDKLVIFETLICYLLGPLAFPIKSYSLSQHLVSDTLACHAERRARLASQCGGLGEGTPALPTASHFQKGRPAGYSTALGSGSISRHSPHCSPGAPEVAWGQPWGSGILCRGPEW